jgi:DNA-directed RNA polymerase subunit F
MAVEKLSVSLPGVVVARARRAAEREGVPLSAWLAEAAEAAADLAEARAAAQDYADRFGEPDAEELSEIRAQLADAGVGIPESAEDAAARAAALARLLGLPSERRAG